jgi:hypothetical protein
VPPLPTATLGAKWCALALHTPAEVILSAETYLRTVSDDDLAEGVYRLLVRTERHIRAALAQEPFALDDLATTLRALLGSSKGNNALVVLAKRRQVPEPTLAISEEAKEGKEVEFSFGAMPTEQSVAVRKVGLSELQRARVLVVRHSGTAQRITWQSLIDDYGNTWGAHLSSSVPRYLDRVQIASSQVGSLGPHLLIALGIKILHAASTAFSSVRDDFVQLGTSIRIEHYVRGGSVSRTDYRTVHIQTAFTDIEPPDGTVMLAVILDDGNEVSTVYRAPDRLLMKHMGYTIELMPAPGLLPKWSKRATPQQPPAGPAPTNLI